MYCTYIINGGFNGYDSRLFYLKRGQTALNKTFVKSELNNSEIFNNLKGCFAWALWNDPDIKSILFDTCKSDINNAIAGYSRVLDLISSKNNTSNFYGIQYLGAFEKIRIFKEEKPYVKVYEASKLRLEYLQQL